MMAPPIVEGVESISQDAACAPPHAGHVRRRPTFYPRHRARNWHSERHLAIVCGRYEGIDDRAIDLLAAEEITIGDYVLTGGELPAMVVIDAVARLLPGVIDAASSRLENRIRNAAWSIRTTPGPVSFADSKFRQSC